MDVKKVINGLQFEWDENKEKINIRKHGISFDEAALVFFDDMRTERYDAKHSVNEDRLTIIGRANGILFVVFTEREENTMRIISARPATKKEKGEYYAKF